MNKHAFVVFVFSVCFFYSATSVAQGIVKGGGIVYTSGAPTHAVNVNVDTEVAIDTTTGLWHERSRSLGWIAAGYRVQLHNATTAPIYTPADKQSIIVVNNADSLYFYRAGSWRHINRWITDGNKGDITVTNSGATWTINDNTVTNVKFRQSAGLSVVGRSVNSTGNVADITAATDGHVLRRSGSTLGFGQVATAGIEDNAVTNAKIASGIAATKIAAGFVDNTEFGYLDGVTSSIQTQLNNKANISHTHSLSDLTQSGAAVGQVPKWNGTAWAPANDETGSGGGGNTDLSYSGTSSPVTLNSSTGADVTITAGANITLSATSNNLTISSSGGVSDGDKGDITVSGGGNIWTIDNGVVSTAKMGGDVTAAGKALLDDADAAAQRNTLGLGSIATQNANNVNITGGTIVANAGSLYIKDNNNDNTLGITVNENLTTDRELTIVTGDSDVSINFSGATAGDYLRYNGTAWAPSTGPSGGNAPTFVFKDADEIVNNSTTFQNDDHLTFTCPANKRCLAEYHIFVTNANGSEIKFQIEATGATLVRAGMTGAVFDFSYTINQASGTMRTYETNGATSEHGFVRISAVVVSGSANRTVNMQWAQFTAQNKDTTVQQGSWLQWVAID